MADVALTIDAVRELIHPMVGLPVSLPWKGYGSAIFLELGQLAPLKTPRQRHNNGEACIAVEWDWRVESEASILFGSSNSGPEIDQRIAALKGTTVQGLSIVGQIPEILVLFSNELCLRSMVMATRHPEWSIKLPDGRWVYATAEGLFVGTGVSGISKQERATFTLAECTANRWGIPSVEPKGGSCMGCNSFVRLDGNGHLLDYGVCISASSPFDGRAVNLESGCPSFKHNAET
jgi:hypothetical protein